ncbi:hypothetical protein [Rothia kristinae]|uniref:Uncharacterized protein n=1 Tax=Rothia kristinae TaxID=37923 RepID=A0A199NUS5_9MICC|nr:hypothetical protein [Rothia kristinae]MCT1357971.1 hypothetical protein [Rothia kristinae]MCT1393186.1 hypothetical protein [Rothia kristinae]MCT1506807.1 hypothetical protein [Rothia kristinae]MCT2037786.1 hypothetical protein [Rothia kristinae]MCT2244444.1 hypothetical protein [Rothia kristinae]
MSTLKDWTARHREWTDEFVLTLRDSRVAPQRIAAELSTARDRAAGGDPARVLGPAAGYAWNLGISPGQRRRAELLRGLLPVVLQAMVLFVGVYAVRGWILGAPLRLNLAVLICWGLLGLVLLGLIALPLRAAAARRREAASQRPERSHLEQSHPDQADPAVRDRRETAPQTPPDPRAQTLARRTLGLGIIGVVCGIGAVLLAKLPLPVLVLLDPRPVAVACAGVTVLVAVGASLLGWRRRYPVAQILVAWLVPLYLVADAGITRFIGA